MSETEKLALSAEARLAKADQMLKDKRKAREVAEELGYKNTASLYACVAGYRKRIREKAEKIVGSTNAQNASDIPDDTPGVPDTPTPRRGIKSGVFDTGEPGTMPDFVKDALHNKDKPAERPYPKTFNISSPSKEAAKTMDADFIPEGTSSQDPRAGSFQAPVPAEKRKMESMTAGPGVLIQMERPMFNNIPSSLPGNFKLLSIQGEFGVYSKDDPETDTIRFLQSVKVFSPQALLAFVKELSEAASAFSLQSSAK